MGASQNYIGTKKKTLKLSDISWMHSPDLHCWRCLGFLIFVASKKYKKMDGTKLAQHVHPKQQPDSKPPSEEVQGLLLAKGKECKPWRLSVMNQNDSAWFIKLSSTPTFLPPNKNKSTALTKYPHLYPNPRIVEAADAAGPAKQRGCNFAFLALSFRACIGLQC